MARVDCGVCGLRSMWLRIVRVAACAGCVVCGCGVCGLRIVRIAACLEFGGWPAHHPPSLTPPAVGNHRTASRAGHRHLNSASSSPFCSHPLRSQVDMSFRIRTDAGEEKDVFMLKVRGRIGPLEGGDMILSAGVGSVQTAQRGRASGRVRWWRCCAALP